MHELWEELREGQAFPRSIMEGEREGITSSPRKNKGGPPIKIAVTTFQDGLSGPGCKKSAPYTKSCMLWSLAEIRGQYYSNNLPPS
jgi:hypothetical protein